MIHDFLLALGFFTRIPVPAHPDYSDEAMRRSTVYFPLVGLIVGTFMALSFWGFSLVWSVQISAILTLIVGFLLTGGFHEDGWADTFDGLGGAFGKEKKLAIMTDSRLGTYGSLALFSLLILKLFLYIELLPSAGLIVFVVVHSVSRWAAMSAMVWLQYVRTETSKSKPVVQNLSLSRWLAAGTCIAPLFFVLPVVTSLTLLITCLLTTVFWHHLLKRQIGGYTGDTLGANQQLNETTLLMAWIAI